MPTEKRGFQISYKDFWRLYLQAHSRPATRFMHYAATFVGIAGTTATIMLEEIVFMPAGLTLAVAMAVGSHRFIEHNRPLIRINALYGAACDLRMLWMAMTGRLAREYQRLGLKPVD